MSELNSKTLPKVTIGMPVYNGGKYIQEALDSLINQTFTDFELLISDNCSTDNTATICKQYQSRDSRIKYFRQESNIGATANFKFVLDKASAEYFMWAACDDVWSNGWIKTLYDKAVTLNAKMVFGSVRHINENSVKIQHPANDLFFRYHGHPLWRRLTFFMSPEFLGKANTICSIYHISLSPYMRKFLDYYLTNYSKYDYVFIYNMLNYTSIESATGAYIYKRVHCQSEGHVDSMAIKRSLLESVYTKTLLTLNPLPKLTQDYFNNSGLYEKLLIILILPLKILTTVFYKLSYKIYTSTKSNKQN